MKYKMQAEDKGPSKDQVLGAMSLVIFNQVFIGWLFGWATTSIYKGTAQCPLPGPIRIFLELVIFMFCEDFFFYYSHRIMHHGIFYANIHKLHHRFTSPVAIATVYAHPVEHIICNLWPLVSGPIILQSHLLTTWFWFTLALCSTAHSHSGFQFPYFGNAKDHDVHHQRFNCNYALGMLDRLHGTFVPS